MQTRARLFSVLMAALVVVIPTTALADTTGIVTKTTIPDSPRATETADAPLASEPLRCSSIGLGRVDESATPRYEGRAVLDAVPVVARSRVLAPVFADFPARPSLVLELLDGSGRAVTPTREAPGLASATGAEATAAVTTDGSAVQVLGSTTRTGEIIARSIRHSLACQGATEVRMSLLPEGVAIDALDKSGGAYPVAWVGSPWAVDATGKDLRTWFEVEGSVLRQHVDATGATTPITFDPTYFGTDCAGGYFANTNSFWYLNLHPDDIQYCPVRGMFEKRNGYWPVMGFETNVANDYGKIMLKQSGGCTDVPDTKSGVFDFQVPCKAHDYCYDLRNAGFSGTVSDQGCDDDFFWLMEAHCNDRVLADQCRSTRDQYYAGVRLPGVVTDPDPASVYIRVFHSAQCLDVEGSSTTSGARILQWPCNYTSNQLWKITPAADNPGYFLIKNKHSGKCADSRTPDIAG